MNTLTTRDKPASAEGVADAEKALDDLREIVVGDALVRAQRRIGELEQRVAELEGVDRITPETLPRAVELNAGENTALQRALQPDVEYLFHRSVRERPDRMAEAIYPVMGPVVRKIVEKLFERSSVSDGRPTSVEQLFLIHRKSGLLLAHAGNDAVASADPDMVSGMLSAVRSYIHEAFGTEDFDGLRTMRVGDVTVRVEWGPLAVLAAVVRGVEPAELPASLERTLAGLHRDRETQLQAFDGDDEPFTDFAERLGPILIEGGPASEQPWWRRHALLLALGSLAALLVYAAGARRDSSTWARYVERLRDEPGIVVLDFDADEQRLHLLVDARARDPLALLPRGSDIDPDDVDVHRTGWFADSPDLDPVEASGDPGS